MRYGSRNLRACANEDVENEFRISFFFFEQLNSSLQKVWDRKKISSKCSAVFVQFHLIRKKHSSTSILRARQRVSDQMEQSWQAKEA